MDASRRVLTVPCLCVKMDLNLSATSVLTKADLHVRTISDLRLVQMDQTLPDHPNLVQREDLPVRTTQDLPVQMNQGQEKESEDGSAPVCDNGDGPICPDGSDPVVPPTC